MENLYATASIGISDLRDAPAKVFERAKDSAVVVLSHNKPAGYIVSPEMMNRLMELTADQLITENARARLTSLDTARKISIDEL